MRPRFQLLLIYLLYWLAFFAGCRLLFLLWNADRAAALPGGILAGTLLHGFPLDLSAAAWLSVIPFLLIALSAIASIARGTGRVLLGYTVLASTALALLAASDLGIFRAWGRRIDAAVLQYLTHPREVWASAGGVPRLALVAIFTGLAALSAGIAWRLFRPRLARLPPVPAAGGLPLGFCALLLVIPARGGLQQIPINQSSAWFTSEPFANQAALNAGWNFFDSWIRGLDRRTNPYVVMPADSAGALVARLSAGAATAEGPPAPAGPRSSAGGRSPLLRVARPNLLLIVWESFTARAVERLGGLRGTTPAFGRLADSGLLFRRFYAAGDRTDKGLAALLSGQPTVPNASILKVPSKAATLPMLSRDLADAGYATGFYYGGELGFANLRSFVLDGRFTRVAGKDDFPRSARTSKWGAHDEAVAERVLGDLRGMGSPFFVAWMTLSSHEPFDVPGPVRVPGSDGESRFLNSLAYTDHVLGDFIARAEQEPWWDRTLVIIVADHSKKLERTDRAVPYKSAPSWYHVPMLWLGGALARRGEVVDAIGSQTDLAPTLLALLGLPGAGRYRFGGDLFSSEPRPFAYYSFDDGFGLVTDRGAFVWEHAPNRITSSSGRVSDLDLRLGRAMLQVAYQDYLDR
ncbi:MAG TPA: LTA synthase family protein [Gemmatimonadales bacterium]|nr:LTA synthase family protein [Gemmatimonadales bacterium]